MLQKPHFAQTHAPESMLPFPKKSQASFSIALHLLSLFTPMQNRHKVHHDREVFPKLWDVLHKVSESMKIAGVGEVRTDC